MNKRTLDLTILTLTACFIIIVLVAFNKANEYGSSFISLKASKNQEVFLEEGTYNVYFELATENRNKTKNQARLILLNANSKDSIHIPKRSSIISYPGESFSLTSINDKIYRSVDKISIKKSGNYKYYVISPSQYYNKYALQKSTLQIEYENDLVTYTYTAIGVLVLLLVFIIVKIVLWIKQKRLLKSSDNMTF